MDFPLNPRAQLAYGDGFGFPVFENRCRRFVIREAFLQSAALVVRLQTRDFERVYDSEPADIERVLRFLNQIQEP